MRNGVDYTFFLSALTLIHKDLSFMPLCLHAPIISCYYAMRTTTRIGRQQPADPCLSQLTAPYFFGLVLRHSVVLEAIFSLHIRIFVRAITRSTKAENSKFDVKYLTSCTLPFSVSFFSHTRVHNWRNRDTFIFIWLGTVVLFRGRECVRGGRGTLWNGFGPVCKSSDGQGI